MVEVHSGDHLLGDISSDTSLGEKCPRGGATAEIVSRAFAMRNRCRRCISLQLKRGRGTAPILSRELTRR